MDQSDAPRLFYAFQLPGGQARLREASLYVIKSCAGAESFGLTKLNKMLWRADFQAYASRRQPVTGRQYQRLKFGPAPVEMPIVLSELLSEGSIRLEKRQKIDYFESRPVACNDPSLRWFSPDDIRYLDDAIEFYSTSTARGVSKHSHGVAWETREDGEPMPYNLALLSDAPLSDTEAKYFAQLGQRRNWATA